MQNSMKTNILDNTSTSNEIVREGIGISPGIVISQVFIHDFESFDPNKTAILYKHINQNKIEEEKERFLKAVQDTTDQINLIMNKAQSMIDSDPLSSLLDAYQHMLKSSRLVRGIISRIENSHINAEGAILEETKAISEIFKAMDDPYISARIEDINDISSRLLKNLQTVSATTLSQIQENSVIISRKLSVADASLLNNKAISGFVVIDGSKQGHTSLLAKSMGIPAVIQIPDILDIANSGDTIIIDGTYGKVILNPTQETIELYRKYRADFLHWKRSLTRLKDLPAVTTDGTYIQLKGNIDIPNEADFLNESGADGVGLFRSEYLYLNRNDLPSIEEQLNALKKISSDIPNKPIVFRTIDIGADKIAPILGYYQPKNPALGLRGVRYTKSYTDILKDQFKAVLIALNEIDVSVLLPMISTVDEVIDAKNLLLKAAEELREQGTVIPSYLPKLGVMIETPSAAIESDILAQQVDFFSIGTNDLTQYTLAVDREDTLVENLYDPLNPAVLRLVKLSIDNANKNNIPVCLCGDIASNYHWTALLVGFGIRELSMPAINIPIIKERIRSFSLERMINLSNKVLSCHTKEDIKNALLEFDLN
ncbi:MAG: phosphoenolpyruvate--protein phosphotransferase [Alphaproteobacteria bacterium]|nr:phosphoenolpyruvate--protein phosphotransferase [Alphaproteobacteria bacterium]